MRGALLLVLICGCRGILGIEDVHVIDNFEDATTTPSDGGTDDAPPDAPNPGQVCLGNHAVKVCVDPQTTDLQLPTTIDTNVACTFTQPQSSPPSICVIAARSITQPNQKQTRVTGPRPLLLVATETISIGGVIDVSSHRNDTNGAGANTGNCGQAGNGAAAIGSLGGGGGAGGSLGGIGGTGGSALGGNPGGTSTASAVPTILRGGCKGGKGGQLNGSTAGLPGSGGGAVYLLAGTRIDLLGNSVLNASGAAGAGSDARCGGSGGGSGGMIGLEAPIVQIANDARLYAIGGGGSAGGSTNTVGAAGAQATDATATATTPGTNGAGNGGAGQPMAGSAGGNSTTLGAAGGGAGGGGGVIWMYPPQSGGLIAPPASSP